MLELLGARGLLATHLRRTAVSLVWSGDFALGSDESFIPFMVVKKRGVATVDPTTVVDAFCSGQFCEVMRQHIWMSFRTTLRWFRVIFRYGLSGVRVGEASNPGPAFQFPTRRSGRLQGARADHRRGLVVEVAPNVVDATAVDLSDVVDGENDLPVVPVLNPMDSDEEDEFDAISSVTVNEPLIHRFNRNVAQRRSIEDAPRRRLRVMGVFQDASQVSLPTSTVPASSTAVRVVNTPAGWRMRNSSTF